ncbi:hypothetical protein [Amycolatopsis deserti]|uniref:hypothetical protein n=1 Tax=Amycolatopsis deserti TaxID=185696 RepID=UPI00174DD19F|nr:hypothetical protein [Amycolatopsis deserti]
MSRFASGSLPVYACGDALVLKLYPPVYPADFTTLEARRQLATSDITVAALAADLGFTDEHDHHPESAVLGHRLGPRSRRPLPARQSPRAS